jgi:hypothetical protein
VHQRDVRMEDGVKIIAVDVPKVLLERDVK